MPITFLLQLTPQALVDSVLVGSLLTPLAPGPGRRIQPRSPTGSSGRGRGEMQRLCAELHPRFRPSPLLLGENCSVVANCVKTRGETLTMHHVSTPLSGRHVVTGLLFDFDESAALLLRPI